MMSKTVLVLFAAFLAVVALSGCGKVSGPRFWWDDRTQARLPQEYQLPDDPAAPAESGDDYQSSPSGSDLTEDNLRDYRADLDAEEERRLSESSLVDF